MGCTQSKESSLPPKKIVKKASSKKIILHKSLSKSNETFKATVCEEEISSKIRDNVDFTPPHSPKVKCHEDEIELIFKSKRANVYTAGATLDNRINYKPKNIIKSNAQNTLIRKFELILLLIIVSRVAIAFTILNPPESRNDCCVDDVNQSVFKRQYF